MDAPAGPTAEPTLAPAALPAPPCAAHPREPAATTCAGCGLFLCAACAAPAPRCPRCRGAGHPIPWEDPTLGRPTAVWRTLKALAAPDPFFAAAPWTGGLGRPVAFAAVTATLGALGAFALGLASSAALGGVLARVRPHLLAAPDRELRALAAQAFAFIDQAGPALLRLQVASVLLTPLVAALELLVLAALTQPVARALGGAGSFEATLRALAYAGGGAVLHAVPVVGGTLAPLATLLLATVGLRRAHGLPSGRAFLAAAWPIPVFGLVGLLLFALLAARLWALLAG